MGIFKTDSYKKWSNDYDSKHSRFWIGADDYISGAEEDESTDHLKLLGFKRAISNFVRIVTSDPNIKVYYNSNDHSFTDGKKVIISSKVDDNKFDVNVGLALHEASHCKLTDFAVLRYLPSKHPHKSHEYLKSLLNVIEDRRIDNYIYTTCPGYLGYYQSMYDEYFNAKSIDAALKLKTKTEVTWDNYLFHIINFTNKNRDLSALPDLELIYNCIDLKNIQRLKSTADSLEIAVQVYDIIEYQMRQESLPDDDSQDDNQNDEQDDANQLSDRERKQLEKQIKRLDKDLKKQREFVNHATKKQKLRTADKFINQVEDNELQETKVRYERDSFGSKKIHDIPTLVIRGHNRQVLQNFCNDLIYRDYGVLVKEVQEGINLGNLLAKRLKLREEERTVVTTRLNSGKISRRLINELGYNNVNIFQKTLHTTKKPIYIHLSLDASGSMSGYKIRKAVKSIVAIAKACTLIKNIHIQVSLRSALHQKGNFCKPLVYIIYDNKVDNFNVFANTMSRVRCSSSTPESLCFNAIEKEILSKSVNKDSYFINFSDGQPVFHTMLPAPKVIDNNWQGRDVRYQGDDATLHCSNQIHNFTKHGIKVLSYFICSGGSMDSDYGSRTKDTFDKCYNNHTSFIDPNDLSLLSKSLNDLLIQGESITYSI